MTDREIDDLWLEAFKASSDDGRVRQRFAELCYQKGAAEMKKRCVEVSKQTPTTLLPSGSFLSERVAAAISAIN
jgi:hypothetical protein